jgi:quinolinate synthase
MAETAKILNPERTVVVPDLAAGCSLADGCPGPEFQAFIEAHPGAAVVSYINCSAEVKALSDVICTSSNAVEIVRHFEGRPVIFAPDRHLGRWVAQQANRPDLILWEGACIVHEQFSAKALAQMRVKHPDAEVLAHPECEEAVLDQADFVGSTAKIIARSVESPATTLIIATEDGVFHQILQKVPEKTLLQAPGMDETCACNRCPYMRLNTLEKAVEQGFREDVGSRRRDRLRPWERGDRVQVALPAALEEVRPRHRSCGVVCVERCLQDGHLAEVAAREMQEARTVGDDLGAGAVARLADEHVAGRHQVLVLDRSLSRQARPLGGESGRCSPVAEEAIAPEVVPALRLDLSASEAPERDQHHGPRVLGRQAEMREDLVPPAP